MVRPHRSGHPSTQPVLAVAATGGHIAELHHLLPRMKAREVGVEWVTDDTPQSRSLLAGERVHWVRPVYPSDRRAVLANLRPALRLLAARHYSAVVSTGSGVALSFLPLARMRGMSTHYVESFTRIDAPSATGRLLARVPGLRVYTQHETWAGERWTFRGSVFDDFDADHRVRAASLARVVVTLGTNPYGFRALLERLLAVLPATTEVLWQTGVTDAAGLPIRAHTILPAHELASAMRSADVVVAHAGIGSALAALAAEKVPVLVPRLHTRGEQSDDHQTRVAAELERRGMAIATSAEELDLETLRAAGGRRVVRVQRPRRFELT
jgi:UDP-N-acetylglucosamine--N-acetylmuramyl-(pentapeptide) pyrophosphoryl-undecaprenol N-acetylglucosamine transferase